jgi:hypothetical protein
MNRDKLIEELDKLNVQSETLLLDLKNYETDKLFKKPAPNVWSPIQILYHLYKSEMLSLQYIKKKVKYLRHELREFLLQISESHIRKNLYRHPIAGRLNLCQMLIFFDDHLKRHKKQIFNRIANK